MTNITEDFILQVLKEVEDPSQSKDIVSLGLISNITVKNKIGNSDIKALANLVSKTLSRDSRILWLSGNYVLDNFSPLLKQFKISVDKFNVYISKPIEFIDHKSIELIANNKVKVILFYSSESTKIWMKLIKNANLYDKIKLINLVGISNKTFSSISEEKVFKYYLSRRKRRASVLAKAIEIFKMPEISK